MRTLGRAVVLGIAFGLSASTVGLALSAIGTLQRRFGPGPGFLLQAAALEIVLATLLAGVGAPLLRLRWPRVALVTWLAGAWLALGWIFRFEAPMGGPMIFAPVAGGLVLLAVGLWIARRRAALAWGAGVVALALAATVPDAYLAATSPAPAVRETLPPARPGAPDVVLVVLDTVRASSLTTHGYQRDTVPALSALAHEGTLFSDATSPSTWSLPSHASLFTGRYPSSHGAHGESVALDQRYPTLAQVLQSRGYETYCFTSNAWISDGLGLTRGFAWQDGTWKEVAGAGRNFAFIYRLLDGIGLAGGDKGGARVADNFARFVGARPRDARPMFVFLNFIEAHFPYHQIPNDYAQRYTDRSLGELEEISMALMAQQFGGPGRPLAQAQQPAIDMYDGGIQYTDVLLSRVVEALRARGRLDETVLVVLADHGEILGEHGGFFGHGPSLYQHVIGVPFVVRYPPSIPAGLRVDTPVSTVAAFATILDLAGIEPPPTLQVGSLAPLARGQAHARPGPVLSERMIATAMGVPAKAAPDPQMRGDLRYRLYRSGSWKLVERSDGMRFLYDLSRDPQERNDLAASRPDRLAALREELETVRIDLALPALDAELATGDAAPDLDEATSERLRQLGYIE